jgi:hypothetical protein
MTAKVGTGQDQQTRATWVQLTAGARLAQVGRTTLHHALANGEIPYATIAGERFVLVADLAVWADARAGDRHQRPHAHR